MAKRLLLADDSITIQKVVELVLAEEDFEIKSVNNGDEALAAISSFKPDIMLVDIVMPKMNGYQLCEKIKANPDTKDVPVILLAGAFEPLDEELARNVGADDHIVKPFESQELISKINAVITTMGMFEGAPAEGEAAEAVEVLESEEDLWAMEDVIPEPAAAEEVMEEELAAEEVFFEEPVGLAEEELEEAPMAVREEAITEVPAREAAVKAGMPVPSIEVPSREEIAAMIRKTVDEKISAALSIDISDIKESLLSSLTPQLKDSADKVLWEVIPQISERLIKEMLGGAFASIAKEVEKVIWETVPDLAETIITREIEKIKSEI
jgi:DNA-binding response OmpR family regulator